MTSSLRTSLLVVTVVFAVLAPGSARANWLGDAWEASTDTMGDIAGTAWNAVKSATACSVRGIAAAGRWVWDHRSAALGLLVPVGCLIATNGTGSYWCILAGAAILGTENAATQLATTGRIELWNLLMATTNGALAGTLGTPLLGTPLRAGAAMANTGQRVGSTAGNLALSRAVHTGAWSGIRTAAGGVRNAPRFWSEQAARFPSDFSAANAARIVQGQAPRLDAQYAAQNPQYLARYLENSIQRRPPEVLVHHHVQGGPIAVPMPLGLHTLSGSFCLLHGFAPNCI